MSDFDINGEIIRKLADLLSEKDLTEIEFQSGEKRLRIARQVTVAAPAYAAAPVAAVAAAPVAAAAPAVEDLSKHPGAITSPMVGTAYLSPEPGAASFAPVGSAVKAGDTVCIIEAMKVFNPIKATKGGTVTRVLVEPGQPVEFGQPLLIIE
ncbi:acetyl-CoA carboxylase biotin carboxyl carrier protein [Radicibacter daui]|uniref:acetyl-CoA carboxylase biotin carboxyl carrier protein n=1 Tax=Radicibacter daui TaxID=3064829 RepID=UPI004046B65C